MQVTKPQALGLSTRPVEFRKRFGLCISATLHLPFAQGERGTLWAEQSMWNFLSREMAAPLIDEGVAKLTPEFLVHGRAYTSLDRPNACAVRARFAGREKTLLVFGDRYWNGEQPSAPANFESMPLGWDKAYGGPDFAANPAGRGRTAVDGVLWLPNIEAPGERVRSPQQQPVPAGFGALEPQHPQRAGLRGTYDKNYLREHAPGFAPDADWRCFNLAPQDQWLDAALQGDETFAFDHMHPGKPHLQGQLPGVRARVFAGYRMPDGEEPKMREVPLRLTTVWFFPHAERCVAIFQGLAEVATDDGSDIASLLGAVERNAEPRPDAYYLDAMARRADPLLGAVYAMVDSDLLPAGIDTEDPDVEAAKKPFASEGLQANTQRVRAEIEVQLARERAVELGQDPDALGIRMPEPEPPPPSSGEALAVYLEAKLREQQAQQWKSVEDVVTLLEKALAAEDEHKIRLADLVHRGPPTYNAEAQLAAMQEQAAASSQPVDLGPVFPQLVRVEQVQRAGYLQSAHLQPPAFPMPAEQAGILRDELARAVQAGVRYFAGLDFTGADFSGLDLRGVNFEGAWLESANLEGANLSGANCARAVLAHARLGGMVAIGTRFAGANLGKATWAQSVCDEADFTGATLSHCDFTGTQMRRAVFTGAQLLETLWGAADWSGARLAGQVFYRLKMVGMRWPEADLSACTFIESDLSGVDLCGAHLEGVTFATCQLDAVSMAGAHCAGGVAVKGSSMRGANLGQADLRGFNFGASDLEGATLVRAQLDGAHLSEVRLQGADMRLASAKGALLRMADCRHAVLSGVNFSQAILHKADLRGADVRHSNLFGADLARVRLDGNTLLDGALLTRARTWPRLTPEQQAVTP